jgi:uncharacterized protein YecE (DUF72 family)
MAHIFAGTSGFSYATWKPDFYPADLPSKRFLEYYSRRLNCVDVNYTFRRLPAATTLENWMNASPSGFLFCPKAHMRITHILRLKESEFTEIFFRAIDPLRQQNRLGPILFQLPPSLPCDLPVLAAFLDTLPPGLRFTFEFRHKSWLDDKVYRLLERFDVSLCLAESEKLEVPEVITGSFVYFRLRKPEYSPEDRQEIAAKVSRLLADGKDVFLFFKHEETPAGAVYAEELTHQFEKD